MEKFPSRASRRVLGARSKLYFMMRYFVDWRLCGGRGAPAVFAKVLLWKQSIGPSARRAQNTGSYVGVYGGKLIL